MEKSECRGNISDPLSRGGERLRYGIQVSPKDPVGRKEPREPPGSPCLRLLALQGHFQERAGRHREACQEGGRLHCTRRKCAKGSRSAVSGPG